MKRVTNLTWKLSIFASERRQIQIKILAFSRSQIINKMDTITIKIEGRENISFFINLLQKFNFIKEITINNKKASQQKIIEEAPIEWADKRPSIADFAGIWSERHITLNDIRIKGWKRN